MIGILLFIRLSMFRESLKFCFLPLIQKELDVFAKMHNTHRIRQQQTVETAVGIPEMLYNIPESFGMISIING